MRQNHSWGAIHLQKTGVMMFEYINKHKTVIQALLALMIVPFMFSGVSGVSSSLTNNADIVAKVGTQEITRMMFEKNYKQYMDTVHAQQGDKFSAAVFDTPEQRALMLDEMVDQLAVTEAAKADHLTVTDGQLLLALMADKSVPKDAQGNIDRVKYEALLKQNKITASEFEARIRSNLSLESLTKVAGSGAVLLPLAQSSVGDVLSQSRLVELKSIDLAPYIAKATVSDEQVTAYYKSNAAKFTKPELFDVEYVVIPVLPATFTPTDDDIKKAFNAAQATAADIDGVRKDAVKMKEVIKFAARAKMDVVAKNIDAASIKAPQNLAALAAQFGGKVETAQNVSRQGDDAGLPEVLKSAESRMASITGAQVAAKAISSPVQANETSLIVGRVTRQSVAGLQPLEVVKADIEKTLKQTQVIAAAREDAKKIMAGLSPNVAIGPQSVVGALLNNALNPIGHTTVSQILGVSVKDFPRLLVSTDDNSVNLIRVVGDSPIKPPADRVKSSLGQWGDVAGVLQQRAFIKVLREKLGVVLYPEHLVAATEKS